VFSEALLNFDYLIYSSHKTGTQTLVRTLRSNGYRCLHFHGLKNIGLSDGDFPSLLEAYYQRQGRPLKVITVFRFDQLFSNFSEMFAKVTGEPLQVQNTNIGSDKWYKEIYEEFRSSLRMPSEVLKSAYQEKKQLINLFYRKRP